MSEYPEKLTSLSGTKDFEKLRNAEGEKLRCGRRHFEAWDVDFSVVMRVGEMGVL